MTLSAAGDMATARTYPRFLDAGETALVVEFGDTVDPAINSRVLALDAALRADPPAGAREFVPTYRSLMIHYNPLEIARAELVGIALQMIAALSVSAAQGTTWILPCCYEEPFSEDLAEAARLLKLSREEVVALHTGATLRVYMYGFTPGQIYLGGVPEALPFRGVLSRGLRIRPEAC